MTGGWLGEGEEEEEDCHDGTADGEDDDQGCEGADRVADDAKEGWPDSDAERDDRAVDRGDHAEVCTAKDRAQERVVANHVERICLE